MWVCVTLVSLYVPSGQRLRTFPSELCMIIGGPERIRLIVCLSQLAFKQ